MEMEVEMEKKEGGKHTEWELKDMAETLQRAAEIQADPSLMKLLKPLIEKKVKAIRSLQDLKDLSKEKAAESQQEDMAEESES